MATLLSEMSRAQVEALSRRLGEPDWMREFRLAAWDLYEKLELPKRTDENWRRTDLTGIDLESVSADDVTGYPAEVPAEYQSLVKDEQQYGLVLRNGQVVFSRLPEAAVAKGLIVTSLEAAIREHGEKVRAHLMTQVVKPSENKFTALHAALMRGGVFVYVPKGLAVEEPISILSYADAPGAGFLAHTLVVAETGSYISLMEQLQSADQAKQVVQVGAAELWPKDGAQIKYAAIQNWGANVWSFIVRRAHIGRDAKVEWVSGEFGGDLIRSENHCWLYEPGAEADYKLLFVGSGEQHLDVTATAVQPAPNSHANILGRGVMAGASRSVYRGLGHLMQTAKGSSGYQYTKTLMLSPEARADSIPGLTCDTDEPAGAGHGATMGQVDPDQIFYLMARGIPEREAKKLIVQGFMAPVLERIALPALRQSLQELIDRKMS